MFSQDLKSGRLEAVTHGRNQNDDHTPVNLAAEETDGGRGMSFAASVLIATETIPIDEFLNSKTTAGFALVIGPVQLPCAMAAAAVLNFPGQIGIDFFQKLG